MLDSGPGFEPGEEDAVLERFYRGRAGRQGPEGTGLGLSIATELAAQWDGRVIVANRSGGGAQVTISFPGPRRHGAGPMKVPTALRWALIALAGLLIAVAVAVLASKLTSQRIGLSSEPLEAGQSLAPPEHRAAGQR